MQLRAPKLEDAEAILAVMIARDVADIGHPDVELEDVIAEWDDPAIDPERDCVVAEDGGRIAGYAVIDHRSAMVFVDPQCEGRGIGTALRERIEARAREREQRITQMIPAGNASGLAHLEAAGYACEHVYQRLQASLDRVPAPLEGIAVRKLDLDREAEEAHAVVTEAFGEIAGNVTDPLDTWTAQALARSEPAFRLAIDDAEGLAGVCISERWEDGVGYVAQVAVARRARGRGYGRALLLAAFDAFRDAGLGKAELSVHGANLGAFRLYESAGMTPSFRQERWAKA